MSRRVYANWNYSHIFLSFSKTSFLCRCDVVGPQLREDFVYTNKFTHITFLFSILLFFAFSCLFFFALLSTNLQFMLNSVCFFFKFFCQSANLQYKFCAKKKYYLVNFCWRPWWRDIEFPCVNSTRSLYNANSLV